MVFTGSQESDKESLSKTQRTTGKLALGDAFSVLPALLRNLTLVHILLITTSFLKGYVKKKEF